MRRFLLCAALAAIPFFAHADTPAALDSKALGPPDRILFWTPEQQRVSYPNMDRIFLTREISRGDPKTHPAFPLPVAHEDYARGHPSTSEWPSYFVVKSRTSMLLGAAIKHGYIKHVNEPVTAYL